MFQENEENEEMNGKKMKVKQKALHQW